jgi:hypothetical protein
MVKYSNIFSKMIKKMNINNFHKFYRIQLIGLFTRYKYLYNCNKIMKTVLKIGN